MIFVLVIVLVTCVFGCWNACLYLVGSGLFKSFRECFLGWVNRFPGGVLSYVVLFRFWF